MSDKRSGLPVGLRRGHQTTPRELKPRPSARKGRTSASRQLVSGVIREVAGFAPYERRAMELLRNGKDKKARKLVKARLGTLRRAKRKVDDLTGIIAEARRTGH